MSDMLKRQKDFFADALHMFVLVNFALAQPLFDLLSRNAVFFVARRSEPVDVLFLISIVCFLVPGALVFGEALIGLIAKRARKILHFLLVVLCTTILFLPVLKKYGMMSDNLKILVAFLAGGVFAFAYARLRHVRTFLTVLAPVLLIFPGLFLFHSPVYRFVFPNQVKIGTIATIKDPPPVIMVVFDEFASTVLLNEEGNIDEVRYPNFAALSKDAYWFRNATTVADSTHNAIPAILTGNYVKRFQLPNAGSYPINLFSLLGSQYDMKVMEQTTHLCPDGLYKKQRESIRDRRKSLLWDLSVVYLHVISPVSYAKKLPVISQGWMHFSNTKGLHPKDKSTAWTQSEVRREELNALKNDRIIQFEQFVNWIGRTKKPTLYFLHALLPHSPYNYLPSGKRYSFFSRIEGLDSEMWEDDWTLVKEAYKRYSFQTGLVDRLVGDLVKRLKEKGLYKQSLIIITADHGISFRPNNPRRALTEATLGDILPVPLFIKIPNQPKGVVVDRNIESIDILPTIAEVLGLPLQWKVDGQAAIGSSLPERKEKIAYDSRYKRFSFEPGLEGKARQTLDWKVSYLGSGGRPPRSGLGILVGKEISGIGIKKQSADHVHLDQKKKYENIDLQLRFIPAQIKGRVDFKEQNSPDRVDLAIAVNGIVRAVTGTFWRKGESARFSTVVPQHSFRKGRNKIEVFIINSDGNRVQLVRTTMESSADYSLNTSVGNGKVRINGQGHVYTVVPNTMKGHLDSVKLLQDAVVFNGWAVDMEASTAAQSILVFVDGVLIDSFSCDMERPDVAKYFANPSLKRVGFKIAIPRSKFEASPNPQVRSFALTKSGKAFELPYSKNYPWEDVSELNNDMKKNRGGK